MSADAKPGAEPAARAQPARESLGRVISVSGSQAKIGLLTQRGGGPEARATVGKFLGIRSGRSLLIGMITEVTAQSPATARELGCHAIAQIDLLGEIKEDASGSPRFGRGVRDYPMIGDPADLISSRALRLVYDLSGSDIINIGHLNLDHSIGAYVNVDEMVSKHFAILGTTGVGKSSGVVLILQQILDKREDLRIFLVDAHNEYGR